MKRRFIAVLSVVLALVMVTMALVGCKPEEKPEGSLGKVIYGMHPGNAAACAAFIFDEQDVEKKYNFTVERVVTTGPNVYAALAAGTMDIGFLGNGMGWHYFEENSMIQILTIDNLTNDDRLLVKKGKGISENETIENLYKKLPGLKMAIDLTTTPGTFLKSLVNEINKGRSDADKVWYEDVEKAYPLKGAADKEIIVVNTLNSNITAVMEDSKIDCCVSFGPQKKTLLNTNNYVTAATTFTHLSDTVTPSTWAVNKEFAAKNPELVVAFLKALVEGMNYRADSKNYTDLIAMASKFDQLPVEVYDMDVAYWPNAEDLKGYYATSTSAGYQYIAQIRASHLGRNGLTEANAKTVAQAFDDTFIKKALGLIK